jgi:hypothetical protein
MAVWWQPTEAVPHGCRLSPLYKIWVMCQTCSMFPRIRWSPFGRLTMILTYVDRNRIRKLDRKSIQERRQSSLTACGTNLMSLPSVADPWHFGVPQHRHFFFAMMTFAYCFSSRILIKIDTVGAQSIEHVQSIARTKYSTPAYHLSYNAKKPIFREFFLER